MVFNWNIILYVGIAFYLVLCMFISVIKSFWLPDSNWKMIARILFFPCLVFDWCVLKIRKISESKNGREE